MNQVVLDRDQALAVLTALMTAETAFNGWARGLSVDPDRSDDVADLRRWAAQQREAIRVIEEAAQ
jgi:hypothetical protein